MLLAWLATLVCLGGLWPWPGYSWPQHPEHLVALAAAGLWLDSRPFRLPTGLFRPSLPVFLAMGALGAPHWGILTAWLSGLLLSARKQERRALWESLLYLGLGMLWLRHISAGPLAQAVVALLGSCWGLARLQRLPRDLQGRRLYRILLPFEGLMPWSLLCLSQGPAAALTGGALLWLVGEGALNATHRAYALQATQALDEQQSSQLALQEARQQLSEQQTHLALEARQRRMMERLAQKLAEDPDFESTQRAIIDTLSRLLAARSLVLYLWNESTGRLEPSCWNSPEHERILQGEGGDPLVEASWQQGRTLARQGEASLTGSLFQAEDQALAAPLPELGILYAGRPNHPFSPQDRHMVDWVCEKASLGLKASWRHDRQRQWQSEQVSINIQLREHVQLLERLVAGAGWLSSQLSLQGALQAVQDEVRQLLHHDFGAVYLGQDNRLEAIYHWSNSEQMDHSQRLDPELATNIARSCLSQQSPAVYGHLQGPDGHLRSAMCVPFQLPETGDREPQQGALLLAAHQPDLFQQGQVHLLSLLSLQLAVTLRNAQLYEEIQQAKTQLERSQAQLIQSSKLTAIGQLAAGVAHELNTPLGAVSLSLDLLSLDYPQGNNRIQNGLEAIERARSIVDKLLIYSRRTHDADREEVRLQEVVEKAWDLAQARLRQEKIVLRQEHRDQARALAKSVELQQVVVNLLLNASDAYGESRGEKPLEIVTGVKAGQAYIAVTDQAGGIPPGVQEQVFDPFFTTKPIGKGTGLGLAISREICQVYEGDLTFTTCVGQGTTFTMSFPALP